MQPTTSNNDSWSVFLYHVQNQADFDNLFINGRGFICLVLGPFKDEFDFLQEFLQKHLQELKMAYQ